MKAALRGGRGLGSALLVAVGSLLAVASLQGAGASAHAATQAAAQAADGCAPPSHGRAHVGHIGGVVHAEKVGCRAHNLSDPGEGTPPLLFHGGQVMGTRSTGAVVVTPIYWNPAGLASGAYFNGIVERTQRDGLTEAAQSWAQARDSVVAALKKGQSLARVPEPPTTSTQRAPKSLVSGRVFLLTDNECASACLDFTDVVRRLPNVTHIGLPTSADALYIDNTEAMLPSGLAWLSYSMKVYRNRLRANNEWYEPKIRWPGGVMSDEAVTTWIAQLAR